RARAAGTLLDQPVHALCPALEDQCFWTDPTLCGTSGSGLHSDSLVRRTDGRLLEVERSLAPLPLPDGRHGWLLTWRELRGQRAVEAELDQLVAALQADVDLGPADALLVTDLDGAMCACSATFAALWGLPDELVAARDGQRLHALLHTRLADPLAYDRRLAELALAPRSRATDRLALADGRCIERRRLSQYDRGRLTGHLWIWRDISRALADAARARLVVQVFDASLDAILVTDGSHRVLAANPAAALLLGQTEAALQGRALHELLLAADAAGMGQATDAGTDATAASTGTAAADDDGRPTVERALTEAARHGRWAGELALRGATAPIPVQATLQWRGDTAAGGYLLILRDQREHQAQQAALHELLQLDLLTGLPNRQRLGRRLAELQGTGAAAMPGTSAPGTTPSCCGQGASTPTGAGCGGTTAEADPVQADAVPPARAAVLFIGLERFTALNDALDQGGGDRVLIEVGMRLAAGVSDADMVTRLGADSFAVLLAGADATAAAASARHLQAALGAGMCVDGVDFNLDASIGIACCPADGRSLDELLRHADSAMQRARQRSGGGLCFYQPRMSSELLPRIRLDHAMRMALVAGTFRLHYQPQVDLASGRIVGAEALLRWRDPQQGEIPPGRFIPVAEESGFIVELGLWVMAEALAQAGRWRAAGLAMPVSVNVSALQFQQAGFVDQVAALLAGNGVPAAMLELELTESVLLGDIETIVDQLERLAALGVRLAIDDFGTGYSGLGYLKRLPIHRLKIDRSFIKDLPHDSSDAAITRSVIGLARALHLQVIAEGVETQAQRDFLADLGCDEMQGWLVAPALEPAAFEARVAAQPRLPRPRRGRAPAPLRPATLAA
ncbi:MAG: hypothetical protein RLZZ584_2656, partial [Pseudomonadota bacterium]